MTIANFHILTNHSIVQREIIQSMSVFNHALSKSKLTLRLTLSLTVL